MGTGIRVDRERVPEVADHFARLFRQKMRGPCASRVEPVCGVRQSLSSFFSPSSLRTRRCILCVSRELAHLYGIPLGFPIALLSSQSRDFTKGWLCLRGALTLTHFLVGPAVGWPSSGCSIKKKKKRQIWIILPEMVFQIQGHSSGWRRGVSVRSSMVANLASGLDLAFLNSHKLAAQ